MNSGKLPIIISICLIILFGCETSEPKKHYQSLEESVVDKKEILNLIQKTKSELQEIRDQKIQIGNIYPENAKLKTGVNKRNLLINDFLKRLEFDSILFSRVKIWSYMTRNKKISEYKKMIDTMDINNFVKLSK